MCLLYAQFLKFLQACSQVRAALLLIVIFNGVSDGAQLPTMVAASFARVMAV